MVPTVLPPVTAEPSTPPATAPPTVPTCSPEGSFIPMDSHAPRARAANAAIAAIKSFFIENLRCKRESPACRSGAAAQQEKHEQNRNGHPDRPQKDPTELAFL